MGSKNHNIVITLAGIVGVCLLMSTSAFGALGASYSDGFETNNVNEDINNKGGWTTTDGNTNGAPSVAGRGTVTNSPVAAGSRSVHLVNAALRQTFSDSLTNVWVSFSLQPVYNQGTPTPPADAAVAFFIFSNGNVVAYNSTTATNLGGSVASNSFTAFSIEADYTADTYDLWVGGTLLGADLAFYAAGTDLDELGIDQTGVTDPAYVDAVSANQYSPLAPVVTIAPATSTQTEESGAHTVNVTLSFATMNAVTVTVVRADVSTSTGDITFTDPTSVAFAAGVVANTFGYTIVNDVNNEGTEVCNFQASAAVNASVGSSSNHALTITDAFDVPGEAYWDTLTSGAAESTAGAVITARLTKAPQSASTVTVNASGTATDPADYSKSATVVSFGVGVQVATLNLTVLDDTIDEATETVILTLATVGGANDPTVITTGGSNVHTYSITDNDEFSLPFVETFESLTLGDLNGQHGWQSSNTIVGTTPTAPFGSRSAISSNDGALYHTFSDAQTEVFTTFYIDPTFGAASAIPADATVAFYINATGSVVAYNSTTETVTSGMVASNSVAKFTVASRYATDTYDLYLDDVLIADNFAFYSVATGYSEFNVGGVGNTASQVDNVNISINSPFFSITNNARAGNDIDLILKDAFGIVRILKRDADESAYSLLMQTNNTGGADPLIVADPNFVNGAVTTRFYKAVNFDGAEDETTNETTWVAQKHFRGSNQWHMLSVPANNGTSADNTLAAFAGEQLSEGITGHNTEASAPKLYVAGASWNERYLDAGGIWRNAGGAVAATDNVDPGEGVWIKTVPPTSPSGEQTGYVTGQTHTNSVAISLAETNWTLISWPFASRQLNTAGSGATEYGWGLANAGVQAGVTYATASRMFAEDGGVWYNLFLFTNSKWRVQNTTADANVGLELGNAYYIYNAGATVNYTASPAN